MLIAAEHLSNGLLDVPAHRIQFHIEPVRFTKRVVFVSETVNCYPSDDFISPVISHFANFSGKIPLFDFESVVVMQL